MGVLSKGVSWAVLYDTYNFVPVESIIELIQVVKRAEKQNEMF